MFDNVHFSGEISLGALSVAIIQLILALSLYIRQLTLERKQKQKQIPGGRRHDDPPQILPTGTPDHPESQTNNDKV